MTAQCDTIGVNDAELRRPDPRIADAIDAALGQAQTVLSMGAGITPDRVTCGQAKNTAGE